LSFPPRAVILAQSQESSFWRSQNLRIMYLLLSVLTAMQEKNYFFTVTFAVGAIFIASPVCGVTTTSSSVTVAYAIDIPVFAAM